MMGYGGYGSEIYVMFIEFYPIFLQQVIQVIYDIA